MRHPLLAFILLFVGLLTGCDSEPTTYNYKGKLSATHPTKTVMEFYQRNDNAYALKNATLLVYGDRTFAYTIDFDANGEIESLNLDNIEEQKRRLEVIDGDVRPQGVNTSPILTSVADAIERVPDEKVLTALFVDRPANATKAWLLAVELRNAPAALVPKIIPAADRALRTENSGLAAQAAFVLSGCGEAGIKQLASVLVAASKQKADLQKEIAAKSASAQSDETAINFLKLRMSKLDGIAEASISALLNSNVSLVPVFDDLLQTLRQNNSGNIWYNVFKAFEREAGRNPFILKRYISPLREIAKRSEHDHFVARVDVLWQMAQEVEIISAGQKIQQRDPINEQILENESRIQSDAMRLLAPPPPVPAPAPAMPATPAPASDRGTGAVLNPFSTTPQPSSTEFGADDAKNKPPAVSPPAASGAPDTSKLSPPIEAPANQPPPSAPLPNARAR